MKALSHFWINKFKQIKKIKYQIDIMISVGIFFFEKMTKKIGIIISVHKNVKFSSLKRLIRHDQFVLNIPVQF